MNDSSSFTLNTTTCIPANAGTVVTTLVNAVGCDSVLTTITTLLQNSSNTINLTTCTPTNAGTVVTTLVNAVGCDSVLTTITTLLQNSSNTINLTTCTPANAGTVVTTLVNAVGCDSVITTITTLLQSSATAINLTTCNSANAGTTTTTLVNAAGCDSVMTTITNLNSSYNNTVNLTSFDLSEVGTVVYNNTTTLGCDSITTTITTFSSLGASITINGLVLSANPSGMSYQWLDCSNSYSPITGETNQTFTVTTNGSYAVEITDSACSDTASCFSVMNFGIVSNDFETAIKLFPNPTSGNLRVEMEGDYENVSIRVTNELGQQVIVENKTTTSFNVDLTSFESGVYFLYITSNNKTALFKVIKND